VREVAGDNDMQVLVLEGGVKGWVKGGERFTGLMDGFRGEWWEGVFREEEEGEEGKENGGEGKVDV
jgi:arsenical-resistance protein 2